MRHGKCKRKVSYTINPCVNATLDKNICIVCSSTRVHSRCTHSIVKWDSHAKFCRRLNNDAIIAWKHNAQVITTRSYVLLYNKKELPSTLTNYKKNKMLSPVSRFRDTFTNCYCNIVWEASAIASSQIVSFRSDEQTTRVKAFSCTKNMDFTWQTRWIER